MLVSCSAYFSALKMESIYSTETSMDFHRITRRYISEDRRTLESYRCENRKTKHINMLMWRSNNYMHGPYPVLYNGGQTGSSSLENSLLFYSCWITQHFQATYVAEVISGGELTILWRQIDHYGDIYVLWWNIYSCNQWNGLSRSSIESALWSAMAVLWCDFKTQIVTDFSVFLNSFFWNLRFLFIVC
jgi:hypothetical protein